MYNQDFDKHFNTPFFRGEKESFLFFWWPFIVIIVGLAIMFLITLLYKKKQDKPVSLYQIEVNTFGNSTTYITDGYKIDSLTSCIEFKDMMQLKRKVCDHYTVTTYIE